jgi:tRNA(Glu) U13 pseudouridine synthase TruD
VLRWQSFLWNTIVHEKFGKELPERFPMWTPATREIYTHLWNPGELNPVAMARLHDFSRRTFVEPKDLFARRNLLGWQLQFDLPPGAYATVVLSSIFDLEEKHI